MMSNLFTPLTISWQQIGNRKSASQNNICNRDKITAKKDIKLKQIYLRMSLDLPSLNSKQSFKAFIFKGFEALSF